jgi:hypothetical protein
MNLRSDKKNTPDEEKTFITYTENRIRLRTKLLDSLSLNSVSKSQTQLRIAYKYQKDLIKIKKKIEEIIDEKIEWCEFEDLFGTVIFSYPGPSVSRIINLYNAIGLPIQKDHLNHVIDQEVTDIQLEVIKGRNKIDELEKLRIPETTEIKAC